MANIFDILGNVILYLSVGFFVSYNSNIKNKYNSYRKPPLSPPSFVFGIVWTILYILIAIGASYIEKDLFRFLNSVQITLNFPWTIVFFNISLKLLSILIILTIIIIVLLILVYEDNARYFYIPYILWLLFALYLNVMTKIEKKVKFSKRILRLE